MSGHNPSSRSQSGLPMNEKLLEKFVETQLIRVKNESKELELKSKDMDYQYRHADKLLSHQAEYLKTKPTEHRKTVTRIAWILGLILIIFLVFIGFCLYLGKDQFILNMLHGLSYFVLSALSYIAGKKSGNSKKSKSGQNDDYEEVVE